MKHLTTPKEIVFRHDYVFRGLMHGGEDSVPIGNGEIGANVWIEEDGLHLLLSRVDSFSEQYRLLKTGHLHIRMSPNPFGCSTETTLRLWDACLTIREKNGAAVTLFSDANYPAYSVSFEFPQDTEVIVDTVNYRKREKALQPDDESNNHMFGCPGPMLESADFNYAEGLHAIGQYHRNESSCYDYTMRLQWLDDFPGYDDPFLGLTFGFLAHSEDMTVENATRLRTARPLRKLRLLVLSHACRCQEKEKWLYEILKLKEGWKSDGAFECHGAYWHGKWEESWIDAWGSEQADMIARCYTLQRYMNICAGRARLPIKFNGSIFTMEAIEEDDEGRKNYDYRSWGAPYWLQNTRLIYWNLLFAGDYDLMPPLFDMYRNMLPLAEYRVRKYFRHEGALIPETCAYFGAYPNYHGYANPKKHPGRLIDSGYLSWYFCGMLELSYMMALYYRRTGNRAFLSETLVPFVSAVFRFFLGHYSEREGKLIIKPTSSLETWHDCVNDTPTLAGLSAVAEELLMPDIEIGETLESLCREVIRLTPELPIKETKSGTVISAFEVNLDPVRRNLENPELYAVFPYLRHTLAKGDLALAIRTYDARQIQREPGWAQDAMQAALLGLADETYEILTQRFSTRNPKCAFPVFWGPNFDYTPDQDHGTVACTAFILSLVQSDENGIRLLPAWKRDVNVAFRLPLHGGGQIECVYENGDLRIVSLSGHELQEILA